MKTIKLSIIAITALWGILGLNTAMAEKKTLVKFPLYYMPEGCRDAIGQQCKRRDRNRTAIKGDTNHHTGLDGSVSKGAGGASTFEHECDGYRYSVTNVGGNKWVVKPLPMSHTY